MMTGILIEDQDLEDIKRSVETFLLKKNGNANTNKESV